MAPGGSETCTGSHTLTQDDIDAGGVSNTATAEGMAPDESTVSDMDQHNQELTISPEIQIVKDGMLELGGDATLNAGDTINYTFEVSNTGNATLSNVSVTDDLVSPVTCPSGNPIPSLAPGGSETCTGSHTLTQDDIDAGGVSNTATAEGMAPDESTVSDMDQHNQELTISPSILIEKDGELDLGDDESLQPGDQIHYTFKVTNTGNVTLSEISVTDDVVEAVDCPSGNPIPSLAPGAMEICSGSYVVTQDDILAQEKVNTVICVGHYGVATEGLSDPVRGDISPAGGGSVVSDGDSHSQFLDPALAIMPIPAIGAWGILLLCLGLLILGAWKLVN